MSLSTSASASSVESPTAAALASSSSLSMSLGTPSFDLGSGIGSRWAAISLGIMHRHFSVSTQLGDQGGVDKGFDRSPLLLSPAQ